MPFWERNEDKKTKRKKINDTIIKYQNFTKQENEMENNMILYISSMVLYTNSVLAEKNEKDKKNKKDLDTLEKFL